MADQNRLFAVAMVAAPLLMLIADLGGGWLYNNFWLGSIAMHFSLYLYIGLILGLYHLSRQTKLALVGTLFAIFGAFAGATIMGLERVAWAMNELDLSSTIIDRAINHRHVFFSSRFIGLTFPVGLIILGITLLKAKILNRGFTVILIVGILLFPAGRIVFGKVANVPGDIILLLIYGKLGVDLLKKGITSSQNERIKDT